MVMAVMLHRNERIIKFVIICESLKSSPVSSLFQFGILSHIIIITLYFITAQNGIYHCTIYFNTAHFVYHCTLKKTGNHSYCRWQPARVLSLPSAEVHIHAHNAQLHIDEVLTKAILHSLF